ncbi:MAG TPA: histidine phosphatase family protein [Chitinophagaceae bacterium]|nr:histidine phosphatase family protein [Chitinophagaceae bacterium]
MKTLIIVRHAKSSWEEIGQKDIDRPLNGRGKKDAPEMAKRLKKKEVKIDLFLSSPAKRAKKTAKHFAEEYNVKKDEIKIEEKLYEAASQTFYDVVKGLPDKHDAVALFSHNPGITEFVNSLTSVHTDNMPTCGVFAVRANIDNWAQFKEKDKEFLFFDYPKNSAAPAE